MLAVIYQDILKTEKGDEWMQEITQDTPLISVVVPVYNVEKYLERCVESIKIQTYKNLEIIIVNDGSQDSSGELCEKIAVSDARVVVIHKENGGLSSARNAGVSIAKGEYIGFVDSDDWIDPQMYELLYSSIKKHQTKISCCGRYNVDAKTGEIKVGLCPVKDEVVVAEKCLSKMLRWDNVDASAVDKLFHRSVFDDFCFPIGVISEDVAVMYQIVSWAEQMAFVPEPLYYYFHRDNSITTSVFNEKKLATLEHSKKILVFVREKYPRVEPDAIYFRCVQLMYVYHGIIDSLAYREKKYRKLLDEIAEEIKQYRNYMKQGYFKPLKQRIRVLLTRFPNMYIFLKKMR